MSKDTPTPHTPLPDVIVSLDSHIADALTLLRYQITATLCVVAIALLAHSLPFAVLFGNVGLYLVYSQLGYVRLMRDSRAVLQEIMEMDAKVTYLESRQ